MENGTKRLELDPEVALKAFKTLDADWELLRRSYEDADPVDYYEELWEGVYEVLERHYGQESSTQEALAGEPIQTNLLADVVWELWIWARHPARYQDWKESL